MGFAVELYFDPETERAIRGLRAVLARCGVRPVLDELGDRPHISLAVLPRLDVGLLARRLEDLAAVTEPFAVSFGAVGAFPTDAGVLFLSPAASGALLSAHAALHRVMAAVPVHSDPYYLPGNWVRHCTVAQEVEMDAMARAFDACRRSFRPISGVVRELGLVRFRPIQPLYALALATTPSG